MTHDLDLLHDFTGAREQHRISDGDWDVSDGASKTTFFALTGGPVCRQKAGSPHPLLQWQGGDHPELELQTNHTGQHRCVSDSNTFDIFGVPARTLPNLSIAGVIDRLYVPLIATRISTDPDSVQDLLVNQLFHRMDIAMPGDSLIHKKPYTPLLRAAETVGVEQRLAIADYLKHRFAT